MVLLTFAEGAGLLLLAPLLEHVVVIDQNPLPQAAGWLEYGFSLFAIEVSLGSVLLLFVTIAAVRAVLQYHRIQILTAMREDIVEAYRTRLYQAIASAEWRFLVTRPRAHFVHALTGEVGRVGQVVGNLTDLAATAFVSAVYLGLALRVAPGLAILVVGSALLLALTARKGFDRARSLGEDGAVIRRHLHQAVSEQLASLKTARVYGTMERHFEDIAGLSRESRELSKAGTASDTRFQQAVELGSTVLLAVLVYVSATMMEIPPALVLVLMFVFARLMPRLTHLYRLLRALNATLPIVDDLNNRIRECEDAAQRPVVAGSAVALQSAIRFEDVSFSYLRRGDRAAVSGLNLRIAAGQTTAIVGASGSGKSTVADLLTGLLLPSSGRICIDDQPLTAERMEAWRSQIGFVPQDTFLFHDTVRANLEWAKAGASEADLWHALRMAAADQFVSALPEGLDTVIGERGVLLSGGERQRLAIARALLRQPSILVLDEATSSLDVEHERRIQEAIEALQHRLTLVIITHRLTTIRHADVIHVMADGAIVQSGTWQQLQREEDGPFQVFSRTITLAGGLA